MLIDKKKHSVISNNSNEEYSYGMKASAKSFEILSSSIYQHKIRAVIRELCCNAIDSHIKDGKPNEPFRIFLPTNFDQVFVVEDFGVGLSHEDVITVLTVYFESTKTESEDEIGALGLGCKSPFAYQSQMSLLSRKDGMERQYSCYIGESGEPKVKLRYEKETDEQNGVKITVPVNQADIVSFVMEAEFVLSFFKTKPECNKELDYLINQEDIETFYDKGFLSKQSFRYKFAITSNIYAVMGGIAYPVSNIDFDFIKEPVLLNPENSSLFGEEEQFYEFDQDKVEFLHEYFKYINRNDTVIFVDYKLGDLNFAASRETLSFDRKTKLNFYKKLVEKVYEHFDEIRNKIEEQDNELWALMYYYENLGNDFFAGHLKYNGKTIKEIMRDTAYTFVKWNDEGECELNRDIREITYSRNLTNARYKAKSNRINLLNMNHVTKSFSANGENKLIFILPENKKEIYGSLKLSKAYVEEVIGEKGYRVYLINDEDGKIDDPYDAIEYKTISEIKDEILSVNPDFFKKKTYQKGKSNTGPLPKNIVSARTFDGSFSYGQKHIDLNAYPKGKIGYILTNKDNVIMVPVFQDSNSYYRNIAVPNSLVKLMMNEYGIDILVVKNGINKNKIDKSGVKCLNELIEENEEKTKKIVQMMHVQDNINDLMNSDILSTLSNIFSSIADNILMEKDKQLISYKKDYEEQFFKVFDVEKPGTIRAKPKLMKMLVSREFWKRIKPNNVLVGLTRNFKKNLGYKKSNEYPLLERIGDTRFLNDVDREHIHLYIDAVENSKKESN